MALRNQPYIPLYVQDYLTDEKLNMCSSASQGIFIKIMCMMHKSDEYGVILLKQKDKQNQSTYLNFAIKLARLLPFDKSELKLAIQELVEEKALYINGDRLYQKRMISDNKLSEIRATSGAEGGKKTQRKFAKAKSKATSEYETEDVIEYKDVIKNVLPYFKKWLDYRKELKKPITVKATFGSLVETFNTEPIEKIKWVIEHSIQNGYQGLFWDKYKENPAKPKKKIIGSLYKCPCCDYKKTYKDEGSYECPKYPHKCEGYADVKIKGFDIDIDGSRQPKMEFQNVVREK